MTRLKGETPEIEHAKQELRNRMRVARQTCDPEWMVSASSDVCRRLLGLPEVRQARAVGLYWPMSSAREVDVRQLRRRLNDVGTAVYLPFMDLQGGEGMRRLEPELEPEAQGRPFLQPPSTGALASRGTLDVIIVPALAVSAHGARLGMGAGFYDRLLPTLCPPATPIAAVFSFQYVEQIPVAAYDQGCDVIVTEEKVIRVSTSRC